ncbi:MAG: OmpH family outer membrane protein [Leeuwenhoekiella sp.]
MKLKYIRNILPVAFLLTGLFLQAQGEVAHINMEKLIAAMPETKNTEAELQRLEQAYRSKFAATYREYQAKFIAFEDNKETMTETMREEEQAKLKLIERNLAQEQQNIDVEIDKQRETLMAPIRQKAVELVNQVGDALGFLYVFDTSGDSQMVMAKGKNLLADVLRQL